MLSRSSEQEAHFLWCAFVGDPLPLRSNIHVPKKHCFAKSALLGSLLSIVWKPGIPVYWKLAMKFICHRVSCAESFFGDHSISTIIFLPMSVSSRGRSSDAFLRAIMHTELLECWSMNWACGRACSTFPRDRHKGLVSREVKRRLILVTARGHAEKGQVLCVCEQFQRGSQFQKIECSLK